MENFSNTLSLENTYLQAKSILDSGGGTANYLNGLSIVEMFCQQHDDHYYRSGVCNLDLNTLHQISISGLCATLDATIVDRLQECVSILYEYNEQTKGVSV